MQSKSFILAVSLAAVGILLVVIATVAISSDASQQQTPLDAPPLTVGQPETTHPPTTIPDRRSVVSDALQFEKDLEPPAAPSILPANWASLSVAEKIALNPHGCSDVTLIRADDGHCLSDNAEVEPPESVPIPSLTGIWWDKPDGDGWLLVEIALHADQAIESIGYGLPDDRIESCDGDTEYDFDSSRLVGADGEGVADSGNSYQIIQYAVNVSADSGISKETGICFYINYQNSNGETEGAISVYSFSHSI